MAILTDKLLQVTVEKAMEKIKELDLENMKRSFKDFFTNLQKKSKKLYSSKHNSCAILGSTYFFRLRVKNRRKRIIT